MNLYSTVDWHDHVIYGTLITWQDVRLWCSYELLVATRVLIGTELCTCVVKRNSLIIDLFTTAEREREGKTQKPLQLQWKTVQWTYASLFLWHLSQQYRVKAAIAKAATTMTNAPNIFHPVFCIVKHKSLLTEVVNRGLPLHVCSRGRSQRPSRDLYTPSPLASEPSHSLLYSRTSLQESAETYMYTYTCSSDDESVHCWRYIHWPWLALHVCGLPLRANCGEIHAWQHTTAG